jgi:transcriptional regulator with GAF, ATPase, and Fis domain
MTTIARAFLAFLAVPLAIGHAEVSALTLARVADPAARAALEEVQSGLQDLAHTMARELEAQRAHSAALEARLGEAEGKNTHAHAAGGRLDGRAAGRRAKVFLAWKSIVM